MVLVKLVHGSLSTVPGTDTVLVCSTGSRRAQKKVGWDLFFLGRVPGDDVLTHATFPLHVLKACQACHNCWAEVCHSGVVSQERAAVLQRTDTRKAHSVTFVYGF